MKYFFKKRRKHASIYSLGFPITTSTFLNLNWKKKTTERYKNYILHQFNLFTTVFGKENI